MQIYVDANVAKTGDGSQAAPFKKIQEAASIAKPGDIVRIFPGIYRESVDPRNSGTKDKPIMYQAVKQSLAVITGAEPADNWDRVGVDVWRTAIANRRFGNYNPYTTIADPNHPDSHNHAGEVFLNNRALYEVDSLEKVEKPVINVFSRDPQGSQYTWYTEQDEAADATIIYANFHGKNPNRSNVELSFRETCFYPQQENIDFLILSGFTLTKAACCWTDADYNKGAVATNRAQGWKILNCNISHAKCSGVSLGRLPVAPTDDQLANYPSKHCIKNNRIFDCGQTGVIGVDGNPAPVIEHNHFYRINTRQNMVGNTVSAINLYPAVGAQILRNCIHDCTRGIWLGGRVEKTRISRNLMYNNSLPNDFKLTAANRDQLLAGLGEDIQIENSVGVTTIDNNFLLSDCALRLESYEILLTHNLINGRVAWLSNNSQDSNNDLLYHRINQSNNQEKLTSYFYNNLFIEKTLRTDMKKLIRLAQDRFDGQPAGNGQALGQNEFFTIKDNQPTRLTANKAGNVFIDSDEMPIKLAVEAKRRGFYLKNSLNHFLAEGSCRVLTVANHGASHDDSTMTIDTDFTGRHREGYQVTPGPLDDTAEYSSCLFRAMA